MHRRVFCLTALAGLGDLVTYNPLHAAQPEFTAIYVTDMHCAACARRIASKLYGVPGVISVKTNVQKHVAFVTPQPGKTLSPLAVWEAVEKANFKPIKLTGPDGVFTEKPAQ